MRDDGPGGPGFGAAMPGGQILMFEERRPNERPTMPEDAHQPPASTLLSRRTGNDRKRRGREGRFGLTADGAQPPRRDGDRQPRAFRSVRVGRPRILPLPPAALDLFEALLNPGAQPVPTRLGRLWRNVG